MKNFFTMLIATGCVTFAYGCTSSDTSPAIPANGHLLQELTVSVDGVNYHADIDYTEGTARIGSIEYSGQIGGVEYKLADGASISPLPESLVISWPQSQTFTISKDGLHESYTVILSAFKSKWPEADGEVIFYDGFDGTELDLNKWTHIPYGAAEWQKYLTADPGHAFVRDGHLVLVAETKNGVHIGAGVKTEGKAWLGNCRIDACVRWDNGSEAPGQAVWMMPRYDTQYYAGWPQGGEIDIMEHSYGHDYLQQTIHTYYIDNVSGHPEGKPAYASFNENGYNIVSVEMTDDELVFFVNGRETMRYANMHLPDEAEAMQWPFLNEFYLILSAAPNSGTIHLAEGERHEYLIDWVRATRISR